MFLDAGHLAWVWRSKLPAAPSSDVHDEFARLDVSVFNGVPCTTPRLNTAFNLTAVISELNPLGIGISGGWSNGHVPSPEEVFCVLRSDCGCKRRGKKR